jgi:signal transduction histidine kinase
VTIDPLLIGQAILNLLLNAAEAIEQGGTVFVQFGPPGSQTPGKQFHLIVNDTGPGIAPEAIERVFNPFFTTKETGTGLGLAIVHRIIEAHDGTIVPSNRAGGGARFDIWV